MKFKYPIIKILVSFFLFGLIIFYVDLSKVRDTLLQVNIGYYLISIVVQLIVILIGAKRWSFFIFHDNLKINFNMLLRINFMANFFNNVLPSSIGGDALRVFYIYKLGHGGAIAMSSVVIERIIGLSAMVGVASISLIFVELGANWHNLLKVLIQLLFFFIVTLILLVGWNKSYLILTDNKLVKKFKGNKLVQNLLKLVNKSHIYLRDYFLILKVFAASVVLHVVQILVFIFIGKSLGLEIDYMYYFTMIPLLILVSSVPFTIGGLGVREVLIVFLFSMVGVSSEYSASVAILFLLTLILSSMPGLLFFMKTDNHYDSLHFQEDK